MYNKELKPFIKWAGGKSQLLDSIRAEYPEGLGVEYKKYCEPFIGGGAVLFDVLNRYRVGEMVFGGIEQVYISDLNEELLNCYQVIKENAYGLVDKLGKMVDKYKSCALTSKEEMYYSERERYNRKGAAGETDRAALFIFLNMTCFNGLYRVNSKGEMNTSWGNKEDIGISDKVFWDTAEALKNVEIVHGGYELSDKFIDNKTFVYLDPPYRPLGATSSFNSYDSNSFGDEEQIKLARWFDRQVDKGAYVVLSNSDPKSVNKEDNFFDELYSKHEIKRVEAKRSINSKGESRGAINEILVIGGRRNMEVTAMDLL
jgi:DNA adenine methylase